MSNQERKEERLKILELLSKGVISADEAEKLLGALSTSEDKKEKFDFLSQKKNQFRMLKVNVDSVDGDQVRIVIPIEFAKLLKTNKKMLKLDDSDFDIDIDSLIQMINAGVVGELVNIKSADGDIVRVVVE